MDRSKNSSRKDGISHKIGDHKHQFRRKDLGGSNLLSRITANRFFFGLACFLFFFAIIIFFGKISLFFWLGFYFFLAWPNFDVPAKSISSETIFVIYPFRFMPAQLTRFGIDRNSAILSIAWWVILLSNFFLPL